MAWQAAYGGGSASAHQASAFNFLEQLATILKDQFGLNPRRKFHSYVKPYPDEFDRYPPPPKYETPDFSKFSGNDNTTTVEHISRYLTQLGVASGAQHMKVRLFSLSLSGPAFGWYTSLAPGSITSWSQLEEQFHAHFFSGLSEMDISDLTAMRQRKGESVSEFIQRFRETHNKCYLLRLLEKDLAHIAFSALLRQTRETFSSAEFVSIGELVARVTSYERQQPVYVEQKYQRLGHVGMQPVRLHRAPTFHGAPIVFLQPTKQYSVKIIMPLKACLSHLGKSKLVFFLTSPSHAIPFPDTCRLDSVDD